LLDSKLLEILRCPETRQNLVPASSDLLGKLNQQISQGTLNNRSGRSVNTPLVQGLVSADGQRLYPVVDDIPVMLIDESILLNP
jgi:uncharacterized protein YbaR (Trm112 family)